MNHPFHHLSAPSRLELDHDLTGEDVLVCANAAGGAA
jgi:hypothetical protein